MTYSAIAPSGRLAWVFYSITLAIFGTFVDSSAQVKPFEEYDLSSGEYVFVGIFSHNDDHPIQKKLGEFYTDDVAVLRSLKAEWVFLKPQRQHACGYHYQFLLIKKGIVEKSNVANLECRELVTDSGSVLFDSKLLSRFKFKPLRRESRSFETVSDARRHLNAVLQDPDVVYIYPPRWSRFEGEFRFNMKCPPELKDCYMFENFPKIKPQVENAVRHAYPGEDFEIASGGGATGGELYITIRCNKSLEEKFDIYDRWGKEHFGKWEAYPLDLTSYRKSR
jgi:hypothetical protein